MIKLRPEHHLAVSRSRVRVEGTGNPMHRAASFGCWSEPSARIRSTSHVECASRGVFFRPRSLRLCRLLRIAEQPQDPNAAPAANNHRCGLDLPLLLKSNHALDEPLD